MASYGFHSEAADEYLAATRYYLDHASPLVATAFVAEIETAINNLIASPTTWPVIEEPEIRRYLLRRFPYSLLLSLGVRVRSRFYLRCHALQQASRLLAASSYLRIGGWRECVSIRRRSPDGHVDTGL